MRGCAAGSGVAEFDAAREHRRVGRRRRQPDCRRSRSRNDRAAGTARPRRLPRSAPAAAAAAPARAARWRSGRPRWSGYGGPASRRAPPARDRATCRGTPASPGACRIPGATRRTAGSAGASPPAAPRGTRARTNPWRRRGRMPHTAASGPAPRPRQSAGSALRFVRSPHPSISAPCCATSAGWPSRDGARTRLLTAAERGVAPAAAGCRPAPWAGSARCGRSTTFRDWRRRLRARRVRAPCAAPRSVSAGSSLRPAPRTT